jgi:hypothetical protein
MGELVGKASACLREAPPSRALCGGQALRRRQGRTFSARSTYISDPRWSSLSVASSDCLKMSTRPPSEALKSGLPMSVFATTGFTYPDNFQNANKPNPMMIKPETLFSHCNLFILNNPCKIPVKPLRISHHMADPMKTPETIIPEET